MNKKYIIGAVIVIVAIWIGFSLGKKSAVAPATPTNGVSEQVATTTPEVQKAATSVPAKKTVTVAPKTTTVLNAPIITSNGSYLISYTSTGFNPNTITIKVGKSVHFVNNSTKAMSIVTTAPDTNQAQSEFNQGKTVGQGGTYDFTFMSAGIWGYMNRDNKVDQGTIVVQ